MSPKKNEKKSKVYKVALKEVVAYGDKGNYFFDYTDEKNHGGVFIETEDTKEENDKIELAFNLPSPRKTIKAEGTVFWVQNLINSDDDIKEGMGIQINKIKKEDSLEIKKYLHNKSSK